MNIFVLIAGFLLILLMVFGRNPVEEAREHVAKYGSDPLVAAINEHNSKSAGSRFGGMDNTQMQGDRAVVMPQAGANPYNNANPYKQPYYQNQNPYKQPGAATTTAPAQNSYYPPPPLSGSAPPSSLQAPAEPRSDVNTTILPVPLNLSPRTKDGYLRSGKKLGFAGVHVYTFNEKGDPVPMPDGTYSMFNGQGSITIKGGKKILISN